MLFGDVLKKAVQLSCFFISQLKEVPRKDSLPRSHVGVDGVKPSNEHPVSLWKVLKRIPSPPTADSAAFEGWRTT